MVRHRRDRGAGSLFVKTRDLAGGKVVFVAVAKSRQQRLCLCLKTADYARLEGNSWESPGNTDAPLCAEDRRARARLSRGITIQLFISASCNVSYRGIVERD